MSNAAITTAFFRVVDKRIKSDILANIATHYGITPSDAESEVTHQDVEL